MLDHKAKKIEDKKSEKSEKSDFSKQEMEVAPQFPPDKPTELTLTELAKMMKDGFASVKQSCQQLKKQPRLLKKKSTMPSQIPKSSNP